MFNLFFSFYNNFFINRTYTKNARINGHTPQGVFWNSKLRQIKRFEELFRYLPQSTNENKIKLVDVGCGYGAMLTYMQETNLLNGIDYIGIDINKKFILECKRKFSHQNNFYVGSFPKTSVDYCLMSGTYNLTKMKNITLCEKYVFLNLDKCLENSKKGIVFNLQQSKHSVIRNNILYFDPKKIISHFNYKNILISYSNSKYFPKDIIFSLKKIKI